ncbi:diguanylate cyclase domain-containing protein, partial [Glaesserella parasuis]|uniref:diguanylate cyclase domain-containing protein n=1 Tax=Glaesserella parasuis TaxID=738 RepID=UPI003B684D2B
ANRLTLAQALVTNQTRQLYHQARHDSLTGLSNRAALDSMLEHMLAMLKAQRATSFTLLFIDLDRFKAVNDSLGHVVGDTLLRRVASRLTRYIPDERSF